MKGRSMVIDDLTRKELCDILWVIDYVRERTNNRGDAIRHLEAKITSLLGQARITNRIIDRQSEELKEIE